ncbi:MAG TPA: LysR family transcriptional regulator [Desulfobacterales bacterium]|nr:LysR family transcriptional regulator [Desulfobacterales bacterium]
MKNIKATLRVRTWFETEKGVLFGIGRVLLLKKVSELGSLNKAAKELGMSYRAAWGKIKATEEKLGCKLLNNSQGAKGFRLTDIGENLLESFDRFQEEVEQFAMKKAKDAFPWKVQNFQASNEPPEE